MYPFPLMMGGRGMLKTPSKPFNVRERNSAEQAFSCRRLSSGKLHIQITCQTHQEGPVQVETALGTRTFAILLRSLNH